MGGFVKFVHGLSGESDYVEHGPVQLIHFLHNIGIN